MKLKELIFLLEKEKSTIKYWIFLLFSYVRRNWFFGPVHFLLAVWYSYYLSSKLFGISVLPKVCFPEGVFKIRLTLKANSKIKAPPGMVVIFEKWKSGAETIICLGRSSVLEFGGPITIGDGCKIKVDSEGYLFFGGGHGSQSSGITAESIILCAKSISIGAGTIISWGCYLSDSSQHQINGKVKLIPLVVGSNVWISEGVTCGPGCDIGDGSIIGAKSYVNSPCPAASFVAGVPAKTLRSNILWSR